jgi:hypothetical protein
LSLVSLNLTGCPALSSDAPPPPRKAEILPAPPRALGAHAAGTDAAPRPDLTPKVMDDSPPGSPVLPDAGAPPAAPNAVTPDAGMAL